MLTGAKTITLIRDASLVNFTETGHDQGKIITFAI